MKKQFVTYEIALAMKELGFNEPCFGYFDKNENLEWFAGNIGVAHWNLPNIDNISAPLWQQVIDWFIEKYQLHIYIDFYDTYTFAIKCEKDKYYNRFGSCEMELKTYNEAREQAILKAIELCKNK